MIDPGLKTRGSRRRHSPWRARPRAARAATLDTRRPDASWPAGEC
ncbi:Hypothetical protein CAP_0861 [Chondromyces apiculatus DSM 436]|uniref:Uncharacterized protein n=1 Tax=Chondromyces apiculatus DSM 436 TaxID=1192034 RepID=A0A017SUX2_9BACT|nr:Hypothetical protein CAP_0861 [Chondromyces apiculatus DSM 436]